MLARLQDVAGVALVFLVQRPEQLAGHDLREAVDGVQRGAQLVAHVRQELGLGLVGGLGAGHGDLVFARQQRQLLLAGFQLGHGDAQVVGGAAALGLLALDGGDVGGGHDRSALGGEAFRQLQPAAVMQFDLAQPRAAARRRVFRLDGQGGDAVQFVLQGPAPHDPGAEVEGVLERLVPQDQPALTVEQDEGVRNALDPVAQPAFGGLGGGLGAAGLGDVQRHAQDGGKALGAARAARLAARVDPAGAPGVARHGEGDLERAIGGGLAHRVLHLVAVSRMDAAQHGLDRRHAPALQPQKRGHIVGHGDLAALDIPLPHAAAGGLDGDAETPLGLGPFTAAARAAGGHEQRQAQHAQAQQDRRDQHPGLVHQGRQARGGRIGHRHDIGAVGAGAGGDDGAQHARHRQVARRGQARQAVRLHPDQGRKGLTDLAGLARGQNHPVGGDHPHGALVGQGRVNKGLQTAAGNRDRPRQNVAAALSRQDVAAGVGHGKARLGRGLAGGLDQGQGSDVGARQGRRCGQAGARGGHLGGGAAGDQLDVQRLVLDRQHMGVARRPRHLARHQQDIARRRQRQGQARHAQPGRRARGRDAVGGATPRPVLSPLYAVQSGPLITSPRSPIGRDAAGVRRCRRRGESGPTFKRRESRLRRGFLSRHG